jgi:superfamily II DNA or RNA helicase
MPGQEPDRKDRSNSPSAPDTAEIRPDAFRFPKLRAASTEEHYNLHIAALEWSLDSPITIRGEADIQSKRMWAERLDPFAHQIKNLITFCRRAPVALFADDVGLGKTISAGLVLSELMVRKKVSRALVVAPKLLLPQWQEELAVKFGIPAETATGAQLTAAVRRGTPVVVSTYQSIRSHLDDLRRSNFDMIILDEAHKLRNLHGTAQPPQFAVGVRQALADRAFKYVLMLTATPIQNRLWDLYSLIDLLTAAKGHTNPLGSPESFKATYIEDARAVQIRRGRREEFRQHLSNYIVRTRRNDAKLVFPTRKVKTHRVAATPVEVRLLAIVGELLREHSLNGLSQSSIGQALMSSPQALSSQLEEMAQRKTVPWEIAREVSALVTLDSVSGKIKGLTTLIEELSSKRPDDWRLVVFTSRTKTQEAIGRHLKALGIPTGFIAGSRANENERAIRAFKEKPPGVRVLVSTDAGAEGINLQVANVLVNFDLPWNPMVLEQRIGRIQRLASAHAEVTILNLVLAGSVEERVVARLGEKLQAISESLGDIEGILESAAHAGEDEDSFEATIRKLVFDSLRGVDVEEATRRAMKSIEEAKEIFEAERETVEKTLGDLRDLHRTGPRVPEISPIVPSVEARDFVLRALTRDGARIRPVDGDLLAVAMPGQNEFRLTFKERRFDDDENDGFFGGNAPRLFVPGKRDFERLAQSWAEKAGSLIVDRSRPSDAEIDRCLVDWLAKLDGFSLADFNIIGRQEGFVGELTCRASVAVAHDRLEKLLTVPVQSGVVAEVEPPSAEELASAAECDTSRLGEGLRERVTAAIIAEPDLTKFSIFYHKRLEEELQAADDAVRQRRLRDQFSPVAAADAVGARGVRYVVLDIAAQVRVDGEGPYHAEFTLLPSSAVAATVSPKSEWTTCQCSGRMVPMGATDLCTLSGQRVLIHLMARSAASGRLALKQHMSRCELTDVLLLPDETELCTITGRCVRKGLLAASAVSGRSALPSEFVKCGVTGSEVLPDELMISAVSGVKFRNDQAAVSVLSGRVGHVSEFVPSVLPEGLLARDEATQSVVSGVWADTNQMVRSERPPGRLGLPSEAVRSDASGRLVLRDEVQTSDVSGRFALPEELALCEFSRSQCVPQELAVSEVSGRRYRSDQQACSILSARVGHSTEFVASVDPPGLLAPDEAERSEVSGIWAQRGKLACSEQPPHRKAFAEEMVSSSVSGKRVLPDEVELSKATGKPALPAELVACAFTGDRVLPTEVVISDVSGKRLRSDHVCTSVHSGRVGHATEFVEAVLPIGLIAVDEADRSAVSGAVAARELLVASDAPPHRRGLPSETVVSAASGKTVLKDEARKSAVSEFMALPEEMGTCEFTGVQVLHTELLVSDVSSRKFRHDQSLQSAASNRRGHASEFVTSVLPPGMIACDEAAASDLSAKVAAMELLLASEAPTHRRGLPDEIVISAVSGKRYLRDEVQRSALSDSCALPDELVACEFTGAKVLPNELIVSDVSVKKCRKDEVVSSVISGRLGHTSEFVRSVAPTGWISMDEAAQSAFSGEWGARAMLTPSARPPHRLGLAHELVVCEVTGQRLLRDEVAPSSVSGKMVDDSLLVPSAGSRKLAIAEEMVVCEVTGGRLLPTESGVCAITGKRVDMRELIRSDHSGLPGLGSLMVRCAATGKQVLPSETTMCYLSGQLVLKSEARECVVTGRRSTARLMQRCPTSGSYFIDDQASRDRMKDLAGTDELLGQCQWTSRTVLSSLLDRCSITGMRVERSQLNSKRELSVLRRLLDGTAADTVDGSHSLIGESLEWLRTTRPELRSAQDGVACRSSNGHTVVVSLRTKTGLFGFSTMYYAVAAHFGKSPFLLCDPVPGKRGAAGWVRLTQ